MNNITILGHLGGDPEQRVTPSGQKVTSFSVAVNVGRKGQDETVWYRVSVWGDNAILQYLKKGSAVIVHGRMGIPRIYQDRNGQPAVSLDVNAYQVEFPRVGRQDSQESQGGYGQMGTQAGQAPSPQPAAASHGGGFAQQAAPMGGAEASTALSDDDLPF